MIYLIEIDLVSKSVEKISLNSLGEISARHLRALRPQLGEKICLLDLRGNYSVFEVKVQRPFEASLVEKKFEEAAKPATHLVFAPPLGNALEQAVEQATEIGFDAIHFIRSERVQYAKNKELSLQRLQRIAEASCKQCGRKWYPVIDSTWWKWADEKLQEFQLFFADESEAQKKWGFLRLPLKASIDTQKNRALLIGPEGGWSPEERAWLQERATPLSLGPHILRVPTAVVSAYTLLLKELS